MLENFYFWIEFVLALVGWKLGSNGSKFYYLNADLVWIKFVKKNVTVFWNSKFKNIKNAENFQDIQKFNQIWLKFAMKKDSSEN